MEKFVESGGYCYYSAAGTLVLGGCLLALSVYIRKHRTALTIAAAIVSLQHVVGMMVFTVDMIADLW